MGVFGIFGKIGKGIGTVVTAPVHLVKKTEETVTTDVVMGLIRHALSTLGGALVTRGLFNGQQENDLVGALMVIIGVIWSIVHHVNNPTTT